MARNSTVFKRGRDQDRSNKENAKKVNSLSSVKETTGRGINTDDTSSESGSFKTNRSSSSASTSDNENPEHENKHEHEHEHEESSDEQKAEIDGRITTVNGEETGEKKKSKGKLFQCTGYPGCFMVFTRSEHLARHIRKHTGERPFECDICKKRFSRLDNLRQHKQTVHSYPIDKNFKVVKKTKKMKRGDELPITPSVISQFNKLSSPPSSVSPNIKRNNNLPPPPPRQPIFFQKHESFSDVRSGDHGKPMPLILDNTSNINDGVRIITPTTGSGSMMDMNSPGGSRLNHLKLQLNNGTGRSPMVSPSMVPYGGIANTIGPMSRMGNIGLLSETSSPYEVTFGSNSATITPTNASFDFQRQATQYASSMYYQRINRGMQYPMSNTPTQPVHILRRESVSQRGKENGEDEKNSQAYSQPPQYISYYPVNQMNVIAPVNQYAPVGKPNVSPMMNQMPPMGHMPQMNQMNPIAQVGHMGQIPPIQMAPMGQMGQMPMNQQGTPTNHLYNQIPMGHMGYVPYGMSQPQPQSQPQRTQHLQQQLQLPQQPSSGMSFSQGSTNDTTQLSSGSTSAAEGANTNATSSTITAIASATALSFPGHASVASAEFDETILPSPSALPIQHKTVNGVPEVAKSTIKPSADISKSATFSAAAGTTIAPASATANGTGKKLLLENLLNS